MNEYEKQAQDFLDKTGTGFKADYVDYKEHFEGDTDKRDVYLITLTRGRRSFSFKFGQSINASGAWWKYGDYRKGVSKKRSFPYGDWDKNKNFKAPGAYDVLSCLTKYDPGDFKEFCGDFGYDTDSKKAEKTYQAVKNEYTQLSVLFSDSEFEEMGEIE